MLSRPVAQLLTTMARGGKSAAVSVSVLREAFQAMRWDCRQVVGLQRLGDWEQASGTALGQWVKAQPHTELWGYSGVKEDKYVWFLDQDPQEAFRRARAFVANPPFEVSDAPTSPQLNTLYVREVGSPGFDAQGRVAVRTQGWQLGIPELRVQTSRGSEGQLWVAVDGRGRQQNLEAANIPALWTWRYRKGLKEAALRVLGTAEIEAREPRPSDRSLDDTGTCGACLANVKLAQGRIMRHGWQVQGRRSRGSYENSWHVGACLGVGHLPWEVSPEGGEAYLAALRAMLPAHEAAVAHWAGPGPHKIVEQFSFRPETQEVPPSDPRYPRLLQDRLREAQDRLRNLQREIQEVASRVQTWKASQLPGMVARVASEWLKGQHG